MAPLQQGGETRRRLREPAVMAWLRLAHVFQKVDRVSADHLRGWNLSVAQFDVLAHVSAAEGLTQQQLADSLLVTKGNVCQLLGRMEADGLIERSPEGRSNRIFLTAKGRDLAQRVIPAQEALVACQFSALSCDERGMLARILRKLDQALTRAEE
ncbi:MAG: MarR family transcriptional regulator [Chloroflexota bacterium]